MKQTIKASLIAACASVLIGQTSSAFADLSSDTETLLNWAERTFPHLFPTHQATHSLDPWRFRYYPQTNIYAGINTQDQNVYVLGGPWGYDNPTQISPVSTLLADITQSGGDGSIPACKTDDIPAGFVYTQSGNTVNITTNGQCIKLPPDTDFCEAPEEEVAAPTGISILTTVDVLKSEWGGVTFNNGPGNIPDSFSGNTAVCVINASPDQAPLTINTDICLDVTDEVMEDFASDPGITITDSSITHATQTTMRNDRVPDCFQTEAISIHDAYTGQTWINIGGQFIDPNDMGGIGDLPNFNY
ncbi:hypothetical protein [Nitrosomonas halophila]|uniref:Prepilin-type processing-associated H-X9-DG domain-containing protein n=1 Tax=Nitrosomonas halophila TaxID=44576 RepID=A0A1H3BJ90_9PROT|nr:hypothetical protein [Nitrosomonas halophila]SDX42006.1 hypothetical protein SAMN05421881_100139 [Nitrosomonas halophila]